jgi:hypothetical protein
VWAQRPEQVLALSFCIRSKEVSLKELSSLQKLKISRAWYVSGERF